LIEVGVLHVIDKGVALWSCMGRLKRVQISVLRLNNFLAF